MRRVEESCRKSIQDLQCDYIDMFFIHWPFPNYHAPGCDVDSRNPDSKPFSVEEFMNTYKQCEELVKERVDPSYRNFQYDNSENGGSTAAYGDQAGSL